MGLRWDNYDRISLFFHFQNTNFFTVARESNHMRWYWNGAVCGGLLHHSLGVPWLEKPRIPDFAVLLSRKWKYRFFMIGFLSKKWSKLGENRSVWDEKKWKWSAVARRKIWNCRKLKIPGFLDNFWWSCFRKKYQCSNKNRNFLFSVFYFLFDS